MSKICRLLYPIRGLGSKRIPGKNQGNRARAVQVDLRVAGRGRCTLAGHEARSGLRLKEWLTRGSSPSAPCPLPLPPTAHRLGPGAKFMGLEIRQRRYTPKGRCAAAHPGYQFAINCIRRRRFTKIAEWALGRRRGDLVKRLGAYLWVMVTVTQGGASRLRRFADPWALECNRFAVKEPHCVEQRSWLANGQPAP